MERLHRALLGFSRPDQLLVDEPMSGHTTFRVGGCADLLYLPQSAEQISGALRAAEEMGIASMVIGNGSNLIVRDGGIRGLVIALGDGFAHVSIDGNVLTAQAGARLSKVAQAAQAAGLAGLEFASGIPGTLGGAVAMNAGAYGGQMSDVLISADVLIGGGPHTLAADMLELGYRTSLPLRQGNIVTSARLALRPDDPDQIRARTLELNSRRRDKQPLEYPSAGSTFKRPEGYFAGALIEGAGLKGLTVGGAQVSEKHAGFIINRGGATAGDILELIARVQGAVFEHSGVRLETEVRVVGE